MRLSASHVCRIVDGLLIGGGNVVATGASIDTRTLEKGDLFFAIKGPARDGHEFLDDAAAAGASACVVAREIETKAPLIVTSNPARALETLAGWVRDSIDPIVIGITGSTGKTGVKDLVGSIAKEHFRTVVPRDSLNNELGVPLTLLQTRTETELVICEMGARGEGQIRKLCAYARPHVGIVTNVGVTHFEQFGSTEAIARTKGELIAALPEAGSAVLNADDPQTLAMASLTKADVITFGESSFAKVRAEAVEFDSGGRPAFKIFGQGATTRVSMRIPGVHQVSNALAATAAGLALGLTLQDCKRGLESAQLSRWRMQTKVVGKIVLVNDAYNANPDSMAAALESCARMRGSGGRLIAILGYMAELGEIEASEHFKVGKLAATLADRLIVVGEPAGEIAAGARQAGHVEIEFVETSPEAATAVGLLAPGDVVLAKGSRVAGLESVTDQVAEQILSAHP